MTALPEVAVTSRFGSLQAEALSLCAEELEVPPHYARQCVRDVELRARFARTFSGGEVRSVHIHGGRVEIINIFHFPPPERAHPIYAMEFVLFGRKPIVGVIDSRALLPHPEAVGLWRRVMQDAHSRHPDLGDAGDPPGWYQECRSGLDFFTRPENDGGMDSLVECHGWVCRQLLAAEMHAPTIEDPDRADHATALARYKDHHRENSPGLPFLHRTFGAEWTDAFLRNALFA